MGILTPISSSFLLNVVTLGDSSRGMSSCGRLEERLSLEGEVRNLDGCVLLLERLVFI